MEPLNRVPRAGDAFHTDPVEVGGPDGRDPEVVFLDLQTQVGARLHPSHAGAALDLAHRLGMVPLAREVADWLRPAALNPALTHREVRHSRTACQRSRTDRR